MRFKEAFLIFLIKVAKAKEYILGTRNFYFG